MNDIKAEHQSIAKDIEAIRKVQETFIADTLKDLMEKYNALVADYNSLVALLEANKADITSVDFAAETSANTMNIA